MTGFWLAYVALAIVALASANRAYHMGMRHGRRRQMDEDRAEVETAIIAKARAEQLSQLWERRAGAVLQTYFGSGRGGR